MLIHMITCIYMYVFTGVQYVCYILFIYTIYILLTSPLIFYVGFPKLLMLPKGHLSAVRSRRSTAGLLGASPAVVETSFGVNWLFDYEDLTINDQ